MRMVYKADTLYVDLEGETTEYEIEAVKNKMINVIKEYNVNNVVIDCKNSGNIKKLFKNIVIDNENITKNKIIFK
jgi:hypothetical protein